jgi:hypothetical protein
MADLDSIDNRFAVMEEALLYPWVMKNYSLATSEGSTLLFKLKPAPPAAPQTEAVEEKELAFGQVMQLSPAYDFPLILQVEVKPTVLGRIAGVVYNRPPMWMTLESGDRKVTKRFIPMMAQAGFMLQPLLLDTADVKSYYRGEMRRVDRLSFAVPGTAGRFYCDKIKIRLLKARL